MLAIRAAKHPLHFLLYPQPIITTTIPNLTNNIARPNMLLETSSLTTTVLVLNLAFSYIIHATLPPYGKKYSPPVKEQSPSTQEVRRSPRTLELSQSNNLKVPCRKTEKYCATVGYARQGHMTEMFSSCLSKLDSEEFPSHFGYYPKK